MRAASKVAVALGALLCAAAAGAYERELDPRALRDAWFLGKDTTFRSERFFEDYVQTFSLPKTGAHVQRIEVVTPFKEMVDRARRAPDGYNPVQAEADYKKQAPPFQVKVRLFLTPTYPAHSPVNVPIHFGAVFVREPDFWREFNYRFEQAGDVTPVLLRGEAFYVCPDSAANLPVYRPVGDASCRLEGADVTLVFDTEKIASRPARVIVETPDGQRVEAEFDLAKLR